MLVVGGGVVVMSIDFRATSQYQAKMVDFICPLCCVMCCHYILHSNWVLIHSTSSECVDGSFRLHYDLFSKPSRFSISQIHFDSLGKFIHTEFYLRFFSTINQQQQNIYIDERWIYGARAIQAGYLIKFIFYLWFSSCFFFLIPFTAFAQISMNNNNILVNGAKNGSDKLVISLVCLTMAGHFKRNTCRFIEMIFLSHSLFVRRYPGVE